MELQIWKTKDIESSNEKLYALFSELVFQEEEVLIVDNNVKDFITRVNKVVREEIETIIENE